MSESDKVLTHKNYYSKRIKEIKNWKVSEEEKKTILKFIDAYETGKITRKTATNPKALIERSLYYLKFILENLKNDNPKKEDTEKFFDNLFKDKYKGFNQKPYAVKTKKSILETFVKYLRFKFPDKLEIVEPLRIQIKAKKKDPPYLKLEEVDALYKGCKNAKERYFIAVLFSSGSRAEEFHNIRFSDIELPKGQENFVEVRLRPEFSKTEGRTIKLYYKYVLEAVKEYLDERMKEGIKPEDPILNSGYSCGKKWLRRLGKRVLNKSVGYHLFRHSCASWLSSRLNRQQLCIFFGWQFSSNMPDVYINRENVDMEDVTQRFKNTDVEELQNKLTHENQELKTYMALMKEENKSFRDELNDVKKTIRLSLYTKMAEGKGRLKAK